MKLAETSAIEAKQKRFTTGTSRFGRGSYRSPSFTFKYDSL